MSGVRRDVVALIERERDRQEELARSGRIPATCSWPIPETVKLAALLEEVGEVARAVLDGAPRDLVDELTHVAAVAAAWLEAVAPRSTS